MLCIGNCVFECERFGGGGVKVWVLLNIILVIVILNGIFIIMRYVEEIFNLFE